jgi:uncharacterized protein (DUF3820 family)
MDAWEIAVLLKPFLLVLYFLPGALIAWYLRKYLPDGRLKRILFFSWKV